MNLNFMRFPKTSLGFNEIIERLETLKSSLDAIEILKANIINEMIEIDVEYLQNGEIEDTKEYKEEKKKLDGLITKPSKSEMLWDIDTLKITTSYNLLHYPKVKGNKIALYEIVRKVYVADIQYAILSNPECKSFMDSEKVFVLIRQHFPNRVIRDLDNQFHSFIFNALRSTQTISDDSWEKLSYMEQGVLSSDKNPKTEIFICREVDMISLLQYVNRAG